MDIRRDWLTVVFLVSGSLFFILSVIALLGGDPSILD